ncbi:hypothetical protein GPALN_002998 [Globodera pallida]|nr:hypothetical protein GPALN_002998 [Globodera pallida]
MDNKSGVTCCCGRVSIETATKVVAIVLCVIDIMCAIGMFILYSIGAGLSNILGACACLLVIYAQKARKPWLFVPYLIIGALEVIGCAIMSYMLYGCVFETSAELSEYDNKCTF